MSVKTLRIARLSGGQELAVPYHVIEGSRSGPTLAVIAAQHGNELHSTMAAIGVLQHIAPQDLRGTVLIVPVANPISFDQRVRSTWIDGLHSGNTGNLNRVWPGRADGFLTERLAHAIFTEVVSRADVVLDIHNGTPGGLAIYYGYHYAGSGPVVQRANELALAFGMEILVEGQAPDVEAAPTLGKVVMRDLQRPIVMMELGDFYGFPPESGEKPHLPIRTAMDVGVTGILNVLKAMEMLPGDVVRRRRQVIISPERRCQPSQGGVLVTRVFKRDIGSVFPRHHLLGTVVDPYTFETLDEIRAPYEQNLLLSATATEPYTVVQPGDQGYHVGDPATARWIIH